MLYRALRPLLFALDAERAHALTIAGLARRRMAVLAHDPLLATRVAGLTLPNPVGLAAGFDKHGEAIAGAFGLGFGFVEIGTVTPLPQPGNARPRVFRLVADEGVVNRYGFNSVGHDRVAARLTGRPPSGPLGVNLGANKDSDDRVGDYVAGVERFRELADYLTINISSPNTPGLRGLQGADALPDLLAAICAVRGATPVFLKLAPDLDQREVEAVVRAALDAGIDALIVGNTTLTRPDLHSRHADEQGGLSGRPLAPLALATLRLFHQASGGAIPLIAAGGIGDADAAWARIGAGASAVQLYTALIYQGPSVVSDIVAGLAERVRREGYASVAEAVGQG